MDRSQYTRMGSLADRTAIIAIVWSMLLTAACQEPAQPVAVATREDTAQLTVVQDSVQVGDMRQYLRHVGEGPPLLLLHGLTNTWRVWRPYLSALSASHQLLVPDLRGHGDTRNPSPSLSVAQVASDMFAMLDSLSIEHVQVVGYSYGGHVALQMAAMQPERVDAMVVIAGAHQLFASTRQFIEQALGSEIQSDWWLTEVSSWHPGGESQVQALWKQGLSAALEGDFVMSDSSLAAIRARTLIVYGDRDPIFPLDVPLELYRKINESQLMIVPNANHGSLFWQDVAPEGAELGGYPVFRELFPEIVNAFLEPPG